MISLYCDKAIRIWDFHSNIILITIVFSEQKAEERMAKTNHFNIKRDK